MYLGSDTTLNSETLLCNIDDELLSNLKYVGGAVVRKLLESTSCADCIESLDQYVNSGEVIDNYIISMNYSSTNQALLEPNEALCRVFHATITVFERAKPNFATHSHARPVVTDLLTLSLSFVECKSGPLSFCDPHKKLYTRKIVRTFLHTLLSNYVKSLSMKVNRSRRDSNSGQKSQKTEKLVASGNARASARPKRTVNKKK